MEPLNLILASNSPRRKQLLALLGWPFQVLPAEVDETPLLGEPASAYVQRIARNKAQAAVAHLEAPAVVLAADTTVVDGSRILGKPVDAAEAVAMLRSLRGRWHQVVTAISVHVHLPEQDLLLEDCCASEVPMRDYSEAEIQAYVASGDALDKAGAYAIQHPGFRPAPNLQSCYANVVGLPLCHLARTLQKAALFPGVNVPQACQATLAYACPVFQRFLGA